jgi:hypothetical protein
LVLALAIGSGHYATVAGLLDGWAAREQRRTEAENQVRPHGVSITLKSFALCAVSIILLLALPWPLSLAVVTVAAIAGPGRRWFVRARAERRAGATGA